MVAGGGGALAWGSPEKKLSAGVEIEDELQAHGFVTNGWKID